MTTDRKVSNLQVSPMKDYSQNQSIKNSADPLRLSKYSTTNKNLNQDIQTQIKKLKKSTKKIGSNIKNPEVGQQQLMKIKSFSHKLLEHHHQTCQKNKCLVKILEDKVKQRSNNLLNSKFNQLVTIQSKKKQSILKWEVERQIHKLKELEDKKQLQLTLEQNRKQWLKLQKLEQQKKKNEKQFRHEINIEKFQMLRKIKKRQQKKQLEIASNLEKQSWRDMKFKQQNNKRLQMERKNLQIKTSKSVGRLIGAIKLDKIK